jgi:hypothetical protein
VDGPGSCPISTTQIDGTVNAANFLFTKWSVLADLDMHVDALGGYKNYLVSFQNCEFYNGQMYIPQKCISSTNCLYRRVSTTLSDAHTSFITNTFCNNLFWAGELAVTHIIIGGFQGPWTFCDNLFDHTVITDSGSTIDFCSNNAYVTTKYGTLSVLPESLGLMLLSWQALAHESKLVVSRVWSSRRLRLLTDSL